MPFGSDVAPRSFLFLIPSQHNEKIHIARRYVPTMTHGKASSEGYVTPSLSG